MSAAAISGVFSHPALPFVGLALCLPLLGAGWRFWRFALLVPGAFALWAVYTMPEGAHMTANWLGMTLTFGKVDALSKVFAHVFAIQAFIGMLYGLDESRPHHGAALAYMAGAFGCLFAGDFLTLFVFWELMSLASTAIVWLGRTDDSRAAGVRYFLVHALGGAFFLAGLTLKLSAGDSLALGAIAPESAHLGDWLVLLGFCVNAAVIPLHAWLPDAYPRASVAGSVFLSAFTTKTAVYVLARCFPGYEILAVMGVAMTIYGVSYATIENDARKILSYHIVSQVGYMVAGIGIGTAMTINGASAHAYAHILYKGLLFMSAGAVLHAAGTSRLSELGGLVGRLPGVMLCYMVAAVSISGLPLFSGFVSKTMTIAGAAEAHRPVLALLMELSAVGTFLSVGLKLPYFAFWAKDDDLERPLRPVPWNMYAAMILSSFLCFYVGVKPELLYKLLPFPVDYHPYTAWSVLSTLQLMGFTGLGFYLLVKLLKPKPSVNLDFDAAYRALGRIVSGFLSPNLASGDGWWTDAYKRFGLAGMFGGAARAARFDLANLDAAVDGVGAGTMGAGGLLSRLQTGRLRDYVAGAVAALAVIAVLTLGWR